MWLAFSRCFTGVQRNIVGNLRGLGNTQSAMVLTIIGVWVLPFPVVWYLSSHLALGFRGLWGAFVLFNGRAAVIGGGWFGWGRWKVEQLVDLLQHWGNAEAPLAD
jgi:Na+-driven multidrug efflux pump